MCANERFELALARGKGRGKGSVPRSAASVSLTIMRYRGRVNLGRLLSALGFGHGRASAKTPGARRAASRRILVWATLAALVVGVLDAGQPIDDYMRLARNLVRPQTPSGQIVIVGIDDKSLEQVGSWPWPRRRHIDMIERLHQAGAKRIFFDIFFNAKDSEKEDRDFALELKRAGNVYLAAMQSTDPITGEIRPKLPHQEFCAHAKVVSVALRYSAVSSVRELNYATDFGQMTAPTLAAELANVHGPVGRTFVVDYAIDLRRFPFVSASDLLAGRYDAARLKGKDVVIAAASGEMGDVYYVPGRGQLNGVFISAAGAETLMAGGTTQLGWLLPLLIGIVAAAVYLFARQRLIGRVAIAAAIFGVTALPLLAETYGLFFDVVPALVLIGAVVVSQAWSNFRQSYKVRGNINALSGLPNLNALRHEKTAADGVLVGARVRNFAEISSSLPPEGERALVEQIVSRLALGARGARIYQGDEGIFIWATTPEIGGPDQLDALHALFRSPALVDGRPIDLSVTLGTDTIADRDLANRIGATLVAADEAAAEGLRWKRYDPAKLAAAEWKLSLLGRLDAAIDSGEVWVAYQPQLDLKTGLLSGAEALVRWSHPEKGEVSPMEFVLAAEQHNRIDKLTAFVLSDAVKTATAFQAQGIAFDVAVNISARLLERPGLVPLVRDMLAESGLSPERLTLEVTESAAMTSGRQSIRTLEEIGSLGINVSIDDYGTGFSTLEYLKKIPATEIKIDRSFIASIDRYASDRLMVGSTIELAHSLGRSVVAEGVETQEILDTLATLGCDKIQGYLIGRPMKLGDLNKRIMDDRRANAA